MNSQLNSRYIPQIRLAEYTYELPDERIADRPAAHRDESRLLVCDARDGRIEHQRFAQLPDLIPPGAILVANDTKVVRARLLMHKETGGKVEFLLLDPVAPSADPSVALAAKGETVWRCMVGGLKKMRNGGEASAEFSLPGHTASGRLVALLEAEDEEGPVVRFSWEPSSASFAEVVEAVGHIPLPPYIRRDDVPADASSYQTVYAQHEGAVAAPTAGLHFTPEVLQKLRANHVDLFQVTLHVGAGTFAPVKGDLAADHPMHGERIVLSAEVLHQLVIAARRRESDDCPLVAVGTTTVRTLESLYWFGVRLLRNEIPSGTSELVVDQWDPYRLRAEEKELPTFAQALDRVEKWRSDEAHAVVSGVTRLMIVPGYSFASCDALITNFHQPGSTLVLLIAAFLGGDLWRKVYREALDGEYRFLSYGDSSLLVSPDLPGRI